MKRIFTALATAIFLAAAPVMVSCGTDTITRVSNTGTTPEEPENPDSGDNENNGEGENNNGDGEEMKTDSIIVKIGDFRYTAALEDNETAHAFAALLPITITMNELNGNEKYGNLSQNLPTGTFRPGQINEGDLMLFGSNCIVLFYKSFTTGYSYSRIGKITETSGLAQAVGNGDITVVFERSVSK